MIKLHDILKTGNKSGNKLIMQKKRYGKVSIYTGKNYDLSKNWFVYFRFKKDDGTFYVFKRSFECNRINTKTGRLEILIPVRRAIEQLLKDDWNPITNSFDVKEAVEKEQTKKILLVDALDEAYNSKLKSLSISAKSSYTSKFNVFKNWIIESKLDKLLIDEFKQRHAQKFIDFAKSKKVNGKSISNTQINNYTTHIYGLFEKLDQTYGDDYNIKNPFRSTKKLKTKASKNTPFSLEDFELIIKELQEKDVYLYHFVKLMYYTFLRPIEICRLKIRDINLKENIITLDEVKSEKGKRKILVSEARSIFFDIRIEKYKKDFLIFCPTNEPGEWQRNELGRRDYWSKRFTKFLISINLKKDYSLYSIRHTASLILYNSFKKEKLTHDEIVFKMLPITGHASKSSLENYLRTIDANLPEDYGDKMSFI